MRRSVKIALILLLSSSALAGAFAARTFIRLFQKPIPITIAEASFPAEALIPIADREGFFRKNGLLVRVVKTENGRASLREVMAGHADFGVGAEAPFVRSVLNGQKPAIVAGIAVIDGGHVVAARRDRGIRSVRNLVGKRIAVSTGTTAEFFLGRLLDYYGMKYNSVHVVGLSPSEMRNALDDPTIDAVCTFREWDLPKHGIVRFTGEGIFTWNFFLFSRDDVLTGRSEAAERLVRSLIEAEAFNVRHRQRVATELAEFYGIQRNAFDRVWGDIRPAVSLDHSMLRALEQEATWSMDNGLSRHQALPDFLSVIRFKTLEKVRPEAATIVHDEGQT